MKVKRLAAVVCLLFAGCEGVKTNYRVDVYSGGQVVYSVVSDGKPNGGHGQLWGRALDGKWFKVSGTFVITEIEK